MVDGCCHGLLGTNFDCRHTVFSLWRKKCNADGEPKPMKKLIGNYEGTLEVFMTGDFFSVVIILEPQSKGE